MNLTSFEKANGLARKLAASLALHQTLIDLEQAKTEAQDDADTLSQIEMGENILLNTLLAISVGTDEIAEA
jgi:hypothetical protein